MSSYTIEVGFEENRFDALGESVKTSIKEDLGIKKINKVYFVEKYVLPDFFKEKDAVFAAKNLFCDPVVQVFSINKKLVKGFDWLITVCYLKGVTDNVGMVAEEGLKDLGFKLKETDKVKACRNFYIKAKISKKQAEEIASGLLANNLIESFKVEKLK